MAAPSAYPGPPVAFRNAIDIAKATTSKADALRNTPEEAASSFWLSGEFMVLPNVQDALRPLGAVWLWRLVWSFLQNGHHFRLGFLHASYRRSITDFIT